MRPSKTMEYVIGCPQTTSEVAQIETERLLAEHYNAVLAPQLCRKNHTYYCKGKIRELPEWTQGLHCSRPWLIYWTLHAADLLGALPELYATVASPDAIRHMLQLCFNFDLAAEKALGGSRRCAGFGGGPGQMPHLAASYAAAMSLLILEETVEASADENSDSPPKGCGFNYQPAKRWARLADVPWDCVSNWFESLALDASRNEPSIADIIERGSKYINRGGFSMHVGGECDVRASYIVATITATVGRLTKGAYFQRASTRAYINRDAWEYVLRCQRYEGGFACGPLSPEVHGGYGQCALSALIYWYPLLVVDAQRTSSPVPALPNMLELRRWLTQRQMALEGGFQGRTNKLVDSCYSHWIGTTFVLVEVFTSLIKALQGATSSSISSSTPSARKRALLTLPVILGDVGSFDGDVLSQLEAEGQKSEADGCYGAGFAILDVLNLNSADVLNLGAPAGARAALRCLCDDEEVDWGRLPSLVATQLADTEGSKVASVESFLSDAADTFDDEAFVHPLGTTNVASMLKNFTRSNCDSASSDDGDSGYEDVEEAELIEEAVARFTHDGAGTLLCNQRALQQYVLKYCQEVNAPSACAPQPAPISSACLDNPPDPKELKEHLMREALVSAMKASSGTSASGLGGLMDKPDHPNDSYHTCYSMSGVASMQQGALLTTLKHTLRRASGADGEHKTLLALLEELQSQGLLPSSDADAPLRQDAPSTFAPPHSSASSRLNAIPSIASFAAGYDGLVVGRVEEDAYYFDELVGRESGSRAALVQVASRARQETAQTPANPNRSNQSQLLSPLNPMANIASRHFSSQTVTL